MLSQVEWRVANERKISDRYKHFVIIQMELPLYRSLTTQHAISLPVLLDCEQSKTKHMESEHGDEGVDREADREGRAEN